MRRVWIQVFALSPREDFICRGLVEHRSYKEMAGLLDLSVPTVKTLAQRAMEKFGVDNWHALAFSYRLAQQLSELSSRDDKSDDMDGRLSRPKGYVSD